MNKFNFKGTKEGYWEEYWRINNLYSKGYYKNGEKQGCWEYYFENSILYTKKYYIL
jgi:antitoxin component YwqK of YwqJK toxin-antitoxin module